MSLICHLSGVHMDTLTCPCNEVALCFYRNMCYPGETSYAWAITRDLVKAGTGWAGKREKIGKSGMGLGK